MSPVGPGVNQKLRGPVKVLSSRVLTYAIVQDSVAFVIEELVVLLNGGMIDHGHDGHGHVGPHDVRVGHAQEEHQRHEMPRAEPCWNA